MGNCLYNGVELPSLPAWDIEKYRHALIFYSQAGYIGGQQAMLYFFADYEQHFDETHEYINMFSGMQYWYYKDGTEWHLKKTFETSSNNALVFTSTITGMPDISVLWGNIECVCLSDNVLPVGTLLFEKSDPIPVGPVFTSNQSALMQGFATMLSLRRNRA